MFIDTVHKYITMLAILVIFNGCENEPVPKIKTNLNSDVISNTVWLSVDENGEPKIDDYQKCKLLFGDKEKCDIQKTFVYSESTYRNPGVYEVRDSVIKLKSYDGSELLGRIYVLEDSQLRLEWNESTSLGDGVEIFVKKK